jgi:signal transduction histidine kinase
LAEEQERRRIAADLHDDVSQTLALTRLQLAAAARQNEDARLREQLDEISQTLLKAIGDTRHLIFELSSPTMNELGLGAAIAEWAEENLEKVREIEFSLVDNLSGNESDEEQRIILFRSVRELLTNTMKHAQARKLIVILETIGDELRITVQDDGIGFDPERALNQFDTEGGFGLFSIQERMETLGGKLELHSAPLDGCKATLSVPCSVQTGDSA